MATFAPLFADQVCRRTPEVYGRMTMDAFEHFLGRRSRDLPLENPLHVVGQGLSACPGAANEFLVEGIGDVAHLQHSGHACMITHAYRMRNRSPLYGACGCLAFRFARRILIRPTGFPVVVL